MFVLEMTVCLAVAILLTALFAAGFRAIGPWGNVYVLFAVIFLASWAGGIWMTPRGPVLWGVSWVPFLLIGTVMALLLAALPKRKPRSRIEAQKQEAEFETEETILGAMFWILLGVLILTIAAHYVFLPAGYV